MDCPRCGHANVSNFRFCEVCLSPLASAEAGDHALPDVVGQFFDDADLIEASPVVSSRGAVAVTRFELPWLPRGHRLGLQGRDGDVEAIGALVADALSASQGQALLVRGELGSGRSRLLVAVADGVRAKVPGTRFLVCSAQGCHRPYSLVERLLRLRFDIPDYLGGTIAGERFERAGEALFGDATGAEVARTCGPMLGFHFWNEHDIDFEDRLEASRRAGEALHALWLRDLHEAPAVLVVDDAGDADAESLSFFAELLPDLGAVPAVLVFAANQRGVLRRPWLESLRVHELAPLTATEMETLALAATAGLQGVTPTILQALIRHAEGRPGSLLAELDAAAKAGAIRAEGTGHVVDPAALLDLLDKGRLRASHGGRFDALGEDELLVARLGAVFGQRFWIGGVASLIRAADKRPDSLDALGRDDVPVRVANATGALAEAGIVVRERGGLLATEGSFRFVEAGDVDRLLELFDPLDLQRASHRAAIWLELVGRSRAAELAPIRAPLWLAAGERSHAAHLYLIAGERAAEELAHDTARRHLEKARELAAEGADDVHLQALIGLGDLHDLDGDDANAEKRWREALGLAWSFRARGHGASVLMRLGRTLRARGQFPAALEHFSRAMELFEAVADPSGTAATADEMGRAWWAQGNTKNAAAFLQRAAELREQHGDRIGLAGTLTNLGILAMSAGQPERARRHLERAVALRREARKFHGLIESLNALGVLLLQVGETDAALQAMQEAYDLSKRVGNRRSQAMLQNNLGEVLIGAGRLDDAEALLYKAVEGAGRLSDPNLLSDAARNLAVAARARNDADRALTWARRSVAAAQGSAMARVRAAAFGTLAEVLGDRGDIDAADGAFQRAAERWEEANDRIALINVLQAHAAFLMRHQRVDAANGALARIDALQAGGGTEPSDAAASADATRA